MENYQLWIPPKQPDLLGNADSFGNIEWTAQEIVDHLYEPLRRKYPDYITTAFLGWDTSRRYPMTAYEFTPKSYRKTVYLQAGVHCLETEGYFGLARLMTLITEGFDRLKALREQVRFLVVPCVSVYGISLKGTRESIMADSRYGIQSNILKINPNRDFYGKKLDETKNVRAYLERYAGEIDFAFDFHTTTMRDWNAYLLPYPNGLDETVRCRLLDVSGKLYEKNRPDCPPAFRGEDKDYPTGPIEGNFSGGIWKEYRIPGSTIEHSDYIFSDSLGTSAAMTRAVELYANHILCQTGF